MLLLLLMLVLLLMLLLVLLQLLWRLLSGIWVGGNDASWSNPVLQSNRASRWSNWLVIYRIHRICRTRCWLSGNYQPAPSNDAFTEFNQVNGRQRALASAHCPFPVSQWVLPGANLPSSQFELMAYLAMGISWLSAAGFLTADCCATPDLVTLISRLVPFPILGDPVTCSNLHFLLIIIIIITSNKIG